MQSNCFQNHMDLYWINRKIWLEFYFFLPFMLRNCILQYFSKYLLLSNTYIFLLNDPVLQGQYVKLLLLMLQSLYSSMIDKLISAAGHRRSLRLYLVSFLHEMNPDTNQLFCAFKYQYIIHYYMCAMPRQSWMTKT